MRKKVIGAALALTLAAGMMNLTACGSGDSGEAYVDYGYDDDDSLAFAAGFSDVSDEDYEDYDEDYEDYEGEDYDEDSEEPGQPPESSAEGFLPNVIEDTWSMKIDGVIYSYKLVDMGDYGTWYGWNSTGDYNATGDIEVKESTLGYEIYLYQDADSYIYMFYGEDCGMIDGEEYQFTRDANMEHEDYGDPTVNSHFEIPEDYDHDTPITFITGTWVYMGYYDKPKYDDTYYRINEDGTVVHYSADDQVIESGTYDFGAAGDSYSTDLYFTFDDGREEELRILLSGCPFIENPEKYYMFRLEDFE